MEIAEAIGAAEAWLADDAVTTHAGALSLGSGVSVTAGTGGADEPRDARAGWTTGDRRAWVPAGRRGRRVLDRPGRL